MRGLFFKFLRQYGGFIQLTSRLHLYCNNNRNKNLNHQNTQDFGGLEMIDSSPNIEQHKDNKHKRHFLSKYSCIRLIHFECCPIKYKQKKRCI